MRTIQEQPDVNLQITNQTTGDANPFGPNVQAAPEADFATHYKSFYDGLQQYYKPAPSNGQVTEDWLRFNPEDKNSAMFHYNPANDAWAKEHLGGMNMDNVTRMKAVYDYVGRANNLNNGYLSGPGTPTWDEFGQGYKSIYEVPINMLVDKGPMVGGQNLLMSYLKGTPPPTTQSIAQSPAGPAGGPGVSLGASSQMTGQYRDAVSMPEAGLQAPPQGFAAGGLIGQQQQPLLAYATGGPVGGPPAGLAPPPQQGPMGAPQQPLDPKMAEAHIQDMLQRNPQLQQQIQAAVQQALSTGQLSEQEAQMAVQLAQACLNNPSLWPQLRQFAVKNGLAGPNDLPQEFDQGLILAILIAARAVMPGAAQPVGPGQGAVQPPGGGQQMGSFAQGGVIRGPGTGTSDSIPAVSNTGQPIRVSNGEFIIPEHVVRAKGTEFFEKLIGGYDASGKPPAK